MTEYDGLTAEQYAERLYPFTLRSETEPLRRGFVSGAEWATEREKARAEAAEARVAELEAENARLVSQYSMAKERRVQIELALRGIREVALRNGGGSALTVMSGYSNIVERADAALATTPTTEAVTEVEGS